jgi:hypothetical protein
VPPGVYPGTYSTMSYSDGSSFLLGGILGFIAGALVFTVTGRKLASSTGQRVAKYIEPKYPPPA